MWIVLIELKYRTEEAVPLLLVSSMFYRCGGKGHLW